MVKPSDFDTELLSDLQAALFIAAPILKVGGFPALWRANGVSVDTKMGCQPAPKRHHPRGEWRAQVASPEGVRAASCTAHRPIKGADRRAEFRLPRRRLCIFRPTQSEMLMLQFGALAVYDQGASASNGRCFRRRLKHFGETISFLIQMR